MAFQGKKPAAIGTKGLYHGFIEPALATSVDKVPSGDRWIHEIKFDGYRVQLHIANDDIKIAAALIGGGALWLLIGDEKLKSAANSATATAFSAVATGTRNLRGAAP